MPRAEPISETRQHTLRLLEPTTRPPDAKPSATTSWKTHQAVVIVAHDQMNPEESIAWVKNQLHPCIIMKQGRRQAAARPDQEFQAHSLQSNHGGSAASYLQFILENYDDLPPVMIFTPAVDYFAGLVRLTIC